MLCASWLAAGCAVPAGGDYCTVAQKPYQWRSEQELMSASDSVVQYIETGAAIYASQHCEK